MAQFGIPEVKSAGWGYKVKTYRVKEPKNTGHWVRIEKLDATGKPCDAAH